MTQATFPPALLNSEGELSAEKLSGLSLVAAVNQLVASLRSTSSGTTAPPNPVAGSLWFDSGAAILKLYDGVEWNALSTTAFGPAGADPRNRIRVARLSNSATGFALTAAEWANLDRMRLSLQPHADGLTTDGSVNLQMSRAEFDALDGDFLISNDTGRRLTINFGTETEATLFCPECRVDGAGDQLVDISDGSSFRLTAMAVTQGQSRVVTLDVRRDSSAPPRGSALLDAPAYLLIFTGAEAQDPAGTIAAYDADNPRVLTSSNQLRTPGNEPLVVTGATQDFQLPAVTTENAVRVLILPRRLTHLFDSALGTDSLATPAAYTLAEGTPRFEVGGVTEAYFVYYSEPLIASSDRPILTARYEADN